MPRKQRGLTLCDIILMDMGSRISLAIDKAREDCCAHESFEDCSLERLTKEGEPQALVIPIKYHNKEAGKELFFQYKIITHHEFGQDGENKQCFHYTRIESDRDDALSFAAQENAPGLKSALSELSSFFEKIKQFKKSKCYVVSGIEELKEYASLFGKELYVLGSDSRAKLKKIDFRMRK